jgi:hypothetical protein
LNQLRTWRAKWGERAPSCWKKALRGTSSNKRETVLGNRRTGSHWDHNYHFFVSYVKMLLQSRPYSVERKDHWWMINLKGFGRKWSGLNRGTAPSFDCIDWGKSRKIKDGGYLSPHWNLTCQECIFYE